MAMQNKLFKHVNFARLPNSDKSIEQARQSVIDALNTNTQLSPNRYWFATLTFDDGFEPLTIDYIWSDEVVADAGMSSNVSEVINPTIMAETHSVATGSDYNRVDIELTSFSSLTYNAPGGVVLTKEYSGSSLKVTHNQGKIPAHWTAINKSSNPNTQIVPSVSTNMQVVDDNTVIFTNFSDYESLTISMTF